MIGEINKNGKRKIEENCFLYTFKTIDASLFGVIESSFPSLMKSRKKRACNTSTRMRNLASYDALGTSGIKFDSLINVPAIFPHFITAGLSYERAS